MADSTFNNESLNTQMQLAYDYLQFTNTPVFLTGKAGTGKTTFLRHVRAHSSKKLAVVAPTGVAAINAGGMTVHSLFQVPFGPIPPNAARAEVYFNPEKKALLTELELLIIDEISMVRPDVLDRIDLILRDIKSNDHPFGGVQLLMIGDLAQLSPIVRDEEWAILRTFYTSPYFFSSLVMQRAQYVMIRLDKVFRQKEQAFVEILNEVRNQSISAKNLALLNERHLPGFAPSPDDPYITLTTHNALTQTLNDQFLETLPGTAVEFRALVKGDFPKDAYPTEPVLKLKTGAQVMFVKNDSSAEKLFYNGKIGTISKIEDDTVFVSCGDESRDIAIQALEWTNIRYRLDGQEISETNAGSFIQVPLKLAWAITVHKSQGLTFDKAIIDVSEAFTHGQTYVALSRCRTLSGMVLRNPVAPANIICDPAVTAFNEGAGDEVPGPETLDRDKERYRRYLLQELFNFGRLDDLLEGLKELSTYFEKDIVAVAGKFVRQPGNQENERVKKAAAYFLTKLEEAVSQVHKRIPGLLGESEEKARTADSLLEWLMIKSRLMKLFASENFNTDSYLAARMKTVPSGDSHRSYADLLRAKPNEALYNQLIAWRDTIAAGEQVMPNRIFSENALALIAEKLPATLKALGAIKGVGQPKAMTYGLDLMSKIRAFQQEESSGLNQGMLF